ncbi:CYTH and CHAD domain-containing protein [Pseudonocardia ailaonensis]|uniref:CYTH and CHAD domain-containing protein n=1 Tax=Pseudonocardia ailaonensis TaxID=367279 RepID=A0ABN2N2B8_9PSEU
MGTAANGTTETERKFEVPEDLELSDPSTILGIEARPRDEVELDATYYDTADLRLARAGVTLRRRIGGDDAGWHLKLPIDADSRQEIRRPAGRGVRPPAELTALARVFSRGQRLDPVAKLVTRRRRWTLADETGAELAELAEDRVQGFPLNPAAAEVSWRELEIELTGDGDAGLLDTLGRTLRRAGVRRSPAPSKLSRVLGDRLPAAPTRRKAGAVVGYLAEQTEILRAHDPLVRLDAPDAVHTMRTTSRRLRSAMQGFRGVLDREATAQLVEDLRWLGGELGPARDAEVTAARFDAAVHTLPPEDVLGPVAQEIARRFAREQQQGRERALAALKSRRYLALQGRLDALLAEPPLTGAKPKRALERGVRKAHKRTADRLEAALATDTDRDEALHEARKAAKRLRYVLEVVEPDGGGKVARRRRRVKALAGLLGDHHDTVTARPVLRELAAIAHQEGGNGYTFGILYAREQAEAERLEGLLPAARKRAGLR